MASPKRRDGALCGNLELQHCGVQPGEWLWRIGASRAGEDIFLVRGGGGMCRRQGVSEDGPTLKLEEPEGREESCFLWTRESCRGLWLSWHGRKFTSK